MKKILSLILAFVAMFSLVNFDMNRAEAADIQPRFNNTSSASVVLGINSDGKATISFNCIGITGVTTKIVAETKLERKWGIFWLDVDGGEWIDTINGRNMALTHYLQLEKTGTYRATTTFTVSGSGGANDIIECESQYVYEWCSKAANNENGCFEFSRDIFFDKNELLL